MLMATSLREAFAAPRWETPIAPSKTPFLDGMALSHHYGLVVWRPKDKVWVTTELYRVEASSQ